jgi:hypothetical protein
MASTAEIFDARPLAVRSRAVSRDFGTRRFGAGGEPGDERSGVDPAVGVARGGQQSPRRRAARHDIGDVIESVSEQFREVGREALSGPVLNTCGDLDQPCEAGPDGVVAAESVALQPELHR